MSNRILNLGCQTPVPYSYNLGELSRQAVDIAPDAKIYGGCRIISTSWGEFNPTRLVSSIFKYLVADLLGNDQFEYIGGGKELTEGTLL